MIALLLCSINCYANKCNNSSTGEVVRSDSVKVSYDDLRLVNSKLIELDYEKAINASLNKILKNDSVIISDLETNTEYYKKKSKKFKRQRNAFAIIGSGITIVLTTLLLK